MPPPIPPDAPLRPEGRVAGRAHSGGTGMFVAFPFVWDPHRGPVLCEGRPHGPQSCPARWRLAPRFLLLTEKFPAQRRPWTGLERTTEMLGFHAAPQRRPASGPGHRRGAVGCARGSLPETSKTGQLGARSGRRGAGRAGRFPRAARSRALGTPPARPSASGRHLAGRARPLEAMAAAPLPGPPWPLWVAKGAGPAASAPPKWAPCAPLCGQGSEREDGGDAVSSRRIPVWGPGCADQARRLRTWGLRAQPSGRSDPLATQPVLLGRRG